MSDKKKLSKKQKRIIILILLAVVMALAIWIAWGNSALELNSITVTSPDLPLAFDGFRIAQVSDLHNAEMGKNNEDLLEILKESEPDIIAFTGDIIDSRRTDTEIAVDFVRQAVKIAPCYYVTGNHEHRVTEDFELLEAELEALGVTVLRNRTTEIERDGEAISIIGIDDPVFLEPEKQIEGIDLHISKKLDELAASANGFTLLISHRPELFKLYCEYDIDLVLSGHAHGGQFRLPLIGGLYAPGQGAFPEYTSGIHTYSGTSMIVSRGIGASLFPFRINNRPEVVLIELACE